MKLNILIINMLIKKVKAQGILEYAALVILVSLAIAAMVIYLNRALDVRSRHLAQELNESNR